MISGGGEGGRGNKGLRDNGGEEIVCVNYKLSVDTRGVSHSTVSADNLHKLEDIASPLPYTNLQDLQHIIIMAPAFEQKGPCCPKVIFPMC